MGTPSSLAGRQAGQLMSLERWSGAALWEHRPPGWQGWLPGEPAAVLCLLVAAERTLAGAHTQLPRRCAAG